MNKAMKDDVLISRDLDILRREVEGRFENDTAYSTSSDLALDVQTCCSESGVLSGGKFQAFYCAGCPLKQTCENVN